MGTSNQRDQAVQTWLSQFGYVYNPDDPFVPEYEAIINADAPAGVIGAGYGQPGFGYLCEACLRARAVLYYKNQPGDCGAPSQPNTGAADIAAGAQIGGAIASSFGASIPGLGSIISLITSIFEAHAQAVTTEQATLCQVSGQATQGIKAIDASVASGAITPAQGLQAIEQLSATMVSGLAKIEKTPTDAAAYYVGIMNAHVSFAPYYYSATAPAGISAVAIKAKAFLTGNGLWYILAFLIVAVIYFFIRVGA
jgi:hypothetical protein